MAVLREGRETQMEVLYEDPELWVIRKEAGLATQSARAGQKDAVSLLKSAAKGGYVGVVHRLDQPVEGLLVFARTKRAAAALSAQCAGESGGILNKEYLAVVLGVPSPESGRLENALIKTKDGVALVADQDPQAKKCALRYRTEGRLTASEGTSEAREIALVRVNLETGRFHQIRAQFAHAGHPLLGDQKYGTSESRALSAGLRVSGVALCAVSLTFRHPVSGKEMRFTVTPQAEIFRGFPEGKSI